MKYWLEFDGRRVAAVDELDSDFPTFRGRFQLCEDSRSDPGLRAVFSYIDFSIRAAPAIERDEFTPEYYTEEARHTDIIESDKWALIGPQDERTSILVPVFGTGQVMNWRLR